MRVDFVTLFPEMVLPALGHSILARAAEKSLVSFGTANPRDFTYDRHGKVDDTPFGGEPGMLIRAEPVALAVEALLRSEGGGGRAEGFRRSEGRGSRFEGFGRSEVRTAGAKNGDPPSDLAPRPSDLPSDLRPPTSDLKEPSPLAPRPSNLAIVLTDPAGIPFTQALAHEFAAKSHLIFLCGHYEGFDHRVKTRIATHAVSIGDYVLTNGELPALVMADAVIRLLPGVLGSAESLEADSHSDGLLSAPNYTRPEVWRGEEVPEVLRSGNHQAIAKWRREQALRLTREIRPDLMAKARLTKADLKMLDEG